MLLLGFLAVPSQSLETDMPTIPEISIPTGGDVQLSMRLIPAGKFIMGSLNYEAERYYARYFLYDADLYSNKGPRHEDTISKSLLLLSFLAVPSQSLETGLLTIPEISIPIDGYVQLSMRLKPAGKIIMGSRDYEAERYSNEGPLHEVTISKSFYIGTYEVTQAQWAAVMGTRPSIFGYNADYPVETVSWDDCQIFLQKLNTMGLGTFRLPTEAEWEYTCRAGSTTRFSWGDDLDYAKLGEYAWYYANSSDTTHPVGQKKPNAWGLYDMYGNVWEWCSDWYGNYSAEGQTDPKGPATGSSRVFRGGGWAIDLQHCRSAVRVKSIPAIKSYTVGFRLVRTL